MNNFDLYAQVSNKNLVLIRKSNSIYSLSLIISTVIARHRHLDQISINQIIENVNII